MNKTIKTIIIDDNKEAVNENKAATNANKETAEDNKATDILSSVDIIINAGRAGSAWSGGDVWKDPKLVAKLQKWVYEGGIFIGVNEPSAVSDSMNGFAMAGVLGVGEDDGSRVCHGRWAFDIDKELADKIFVNGSDIPAKADIYLTDGEAKVLAEKNCLPTFTIHEYGRGKGVYMSGFEKNNANTRMLLNLLIHTKGLDEDQSYITDDPDTECAYYPDSRKLVVINNSEAEKHTKVRTGKGVVEFDLKPFESRIAEI